MASSRSLIWICASVELGHVPEVVYVTVYVAGVLALISMLPVAEFIESPEGVALYVPPANPEITGVASVLFTQ